MEPNTVELEQLNEQTREHVETFDTLTAKFTAVAAETESLKSENSRPPTLVGQAPGEAAHAQSENECVKTENETLRATVLQASNELTQ